MLLQPFSSVAGQCFPSIHSRAMSPKLGDFLKLQKKCDIHSGQSSLGGVFNFRKNGEKMFHRSMAMVFCVNFGDARIVVRHPLIGSM